MNNFIELHRYDGEPVLINTRHMTAVVRNKSSTKDVLVFLRSENDSVTVTESYEEVKRLLATVEYVYKEEA